MNSRMIGARQDVVGFALAGVDAVVASTRAEVIAALESAQRDPRIAVVIVAPAAAAVAMDVIERSRESGRLPITIVLPDPSVGAERPHAL